MSGQSQVLNDRALRNAQQVTRPASVDNRQQVLGLDPAQVSLNQQETRLWQEFRTAHSHLTNRELDKIDSAVLRVAHIRIRMAFLYYYRGGFFGHQIYKMDNNRAVQARQTGLYADTNPASDTYLRPDLLSPTFATDLLGILLMHEFTHTRHITSVGGVSDYQEGDSYAIEYFLAERIGSSATTARAREILGVMNNPTRIVSSGLIPALKLSFKTTYATMVILYEIIDGRPSRTGENITRDQAQVLSAELLSKKPDDRSVQINRISEWVKNNLSSFRLPPI